jgi:hypothetical protein
VAFLTLMPSRENGLPLVPTAASTEHSISGSFMRKPSLLQRSNVGTGYDHEKLYSRIDAPTRYGSSPEHPNPPAKDKHQQLYRQVMLYADRISSDITQADYYSSYYSTLVHDQRWNRLLIAVNVTAFLHLTLRT